MSAAGSVSRRDALPSPDSNFAPHVAWRTIAGPQGSVIAVHQASTTQSLSTQVQGGYGGGGGCNALGPLGVPPTPGGGLGQGAPLVGDDGGVSVPASDSAGAGGCYTMVDAAIRNADAGLTSPPLNAHCGPETGAVKSVLSIVASDGTVTVNQEFAGVLPVDVAVSRRRFASRRRRGGQRVHFVSEHRLRVRRVRRADGELSDELAPGHRRRVRRPRTTSSCRRESRPASWCSSRATARRSTISLQRFSSGHGLRHLPHASRRHDRLRVVPPRGR